MLMVRQLSEREADVTCWMMDMLRASEGGGGGVLLYDLGWERKIAVHCGDSTSMNGSRKLGLRLQLL